MSRINPHKAAGPDNITCSDAKHSLKQAVILTGQKGATIIQRHKKSNVTCLKYITDSVPMKCFELVVGHITASL